MASENQHARPNSARKSPKKSNNKAQEMTLCKTNVTSSNATSKTPVEITMKDFFDFMKTAYQIYEYVEGDVETAPGGMKIDWDELEKNPVVKIMMDMCITKCDEGAAGRRGSEGGASLDPLENCSTSGFIISDLDSHDMQTGKLKKCAEPRRNSLSTFTRKSVTSKKESKADDNGIDALLMSKLSEVLNEGILDSVLSYMVSYSKLSKVKNCHQPIIKKPVSYNNNVDVKKTESFGGFFMEREGKEKLGITQRDKLGRRKSSVSGDKHIFRGDGEVEIHVCDEVKGLKKDFRCPQKLLVSKMGYFADVTSGQKLEDMDISVHCDIQIFDWLMRWVKKDTILVADWPILDPTNVVPILVSASFLQMDPLLHDCLMYCHSHMTEIVKTNTNLACLNDTILTRLGAMYTNTELEAIRDKKDKIQSRLFCKMIMSLGEPVPETLRGHYTSLATLYKCSSCSKLLARQIADRIPCQAANMSIDRRGNVISAHTRDLSWNLSEYITSLYTEMKSWRKVYWRLWGESHFLKCTTCDNHFPINQMEWCCYHNDMPQFFSPDPVKSTCLPLGRYPCCSQRAYRFQVLTHTAQGCQFREHISEQHSDYEAAVLAIFNDYRNIIAIPPPKLQFPERFIRLITRENELTTAKLNAHEMFWWEGLKLAPPRLPLGLLGKLYSGSVNSKTQANNKNNGMSSTSTASFYSMPSLTQCTSSAVIEAGNDTVKNTETKSTKLGEKPSEIKTVAQKVESDEESSSGRSESSSSSTTSESSSSTSSAESSHSEESSPQRTSNSRRNIRKGRPRVLTKRRCTGSGGRLWAATLSARSNQDHQRQYEERTARQMRALLSRRVSNQNLRLDQPLGGVYVRLEAEWKQTNQSNAALRSARQLYSAKVVRSKFTK